MILLALSVRDVVADSFGQSVFVQTLGLGIRSFKDALSSRDGEMARHPEDYELYHVGQFNVEEGKFSSPAHPVLLLKGGAIVKEAANVS